MSTCSTRRAYPAASAIEIWCCGARSSHLFEWQTLTRNIFVLPASTLVQELGLVVRTDEQPVSINTRNPFNRNQIANRSTPLLHLERKPTIVTLPASGFLRRDNSTTEVGTI